MNQYTFTRIGPFGAESKECEESVATATDEELVRKSKEDDERAFGELVSRYESKVYSLALRMVRNPEDAEDVLQDTFLRAYRGIKSFQGASTFSTWIYRITANSALMRLRKKQLPTVSIDDAEERRRRSTSPTGLRARWSSC